MKDRGLSLIIIVSMLAITFGPADDAGAAPTRLKGVRQSIQRSGARWVAGETVISQLPPEERRRYLGTIRKPESRATSPTPFDTADNLPPRIDWRSHRGSNWVTNPKNQGACGSCVVFAAVGALESAIAIQANNPDLVLDLSEQFPLSCSGASCRGWWLSPMLNFLLYTGTVDESCFPYQRDDTISCNRRCADWQSRSRRITGWVPVPNEVDAIRTALNTQPVPVCFDVYTDFFYYTRGVYEHVSGELEGGHCVVAVGYDDVEHAWIAKNSWGPFWGQDGFFKILWGDSNFGDDAMLINYSNPCDDDEDGFQDTACGGDDCDDEDNLVHPGAEEKCDGKDNDCDSRLSPAEVDRDGDEWPRCNDCDDSDPTVNPGATETCGDAIDNDCNGLIDDKDLDEDGVLDTACGGDDCNDEEATVYSGATELCDGIDNNCDGIITEDEEDYDGDTWTVCGGDCNDDNESAHPGASEICDNEEDDDCDGQVDGDDSECSGVPWTPGVAPAEASIPEASLPVSRISNTGLWLVLPLLFLTMARVIRRHRKHRQPSS